MTNTMQRPLLAGDDPGDAFDPEDYRTSDPRLSTFAVTTLPAGVSPSTATPGAVKVVHVLAQNHAAAFEHADVRRVLAGGKRYVAEVRLETTGQRGSIDSAATGGDDMARAIANRAREVAEFDERDPGFRGAPPPGWRRG